MQKKVMARCLRMQFFFGQPCIINTDGSNTHKAIAALTDWHIPKWHLKKADLSVTSRVSNRT